MNTYQIAPCGAGYHFTELTAEGVALVTLTLPTLREARNWLIHSMANPTQEEIEEHFLDWAAWDN